MLFVDVVGSMDLAGRMDPEEWGELMERFFAILRDGINRFDGRIDKFTGDGVMALFGAPIALEDHARRACGAVLHLHEELVGYAREIERDMGIRFAVRMGLSSGEVVTGAVGEDLKVEYTAVGNTVGLAQRMESLAEPGTANLSAATASLVEGFFELRPLGAMQAKGAGDPVAVFRLVGPGMLRTPLEVAAARGLSRFVGRDREMAALEGAFSEAIGGNGQVIGVVAEPGVGKSRLCHEFAERCRAQGVQVFSAHGLAHARSTPFVPVLEILRAQFGIREGDDSSTARVKVAGTVLELDPELDDVLPLVYEFLGAGDPQRPAPVIDPEARQRQLFGAFDRLRRAWSTRGGIVMIIEDLHWLDPGSQAFLENLIDSVPGTRLLVLTTFRPEYRAPWVHRSHYGQVPLLPLGDEATAELLLDLLGPDPSLDGVAALVRERTGGNPFFIQEVVQGLVEERHLAGRRGAYTLKRTIDEVRIPATVEAVLAARVDRLSERDKALLQSASVIGRQFPRRLLGRVSQLADEELEAALRTLVDSEFIFETSGYPEAEYTFKHALTEDVAYRSQLAKRRAPTHAVVARALTELDDDKLDERASLIGQHYEKGGEKLEAARWNARAATWAGFSRPVEAARHWRRVRALTDSLEASPDAAELGIKARLMLLGCHWRLGAASEEGEIRYEEEAAAVFAEADRLSDATGQSTVKVLLLALYGAVRLMTDGVEDGHEFNLRAMRLAEEIGDLGLRASVGILLGWSLYVLGRAGEAAAMTEEIISLIGEDRSVGRGLVFTSPYAGTRMARAVYAAHCGRLDEELVAIERAIELLGEEGDPEMQSHGHRGWAVVADLAGADPDTAAWHAHQALEWAEVAGGPWSRIFNREAVAISHAQRGEWRQAIDVVHEALAIARERRIALANVPLLLATKARAQIGLGDAAPARSSAEEGIAVAVRCGARYYEARARIELARGIIADPFPGQEERADAELDRAFSIIDTLGLRAYAPQIHVERARLALTIGDESGYRRELQKAHRLFLDVGAYGRAEEVASAVRF